MSGANGSAPPADDLEFLRLQARPAYEAGADPVRVADLFCGCGALTLGIAEALRRLGRGIEVALAIDEDPDAADVYGANFPGAAVKTESVEALFDGGLGEALTLTERATARAAGAVGIVVAGPPCQGHSNLNNHTRRDDPRNKLYARAIRAAEVLKPELLIVENVPGVVHDKGEVTVNAVATLTAAGYQCTREVVRVEEAGVPQKRRRHLLVAARSFSPVSAVEAIQGSEERTVRWAIGDLEKVEPASDFDRPGSLSEDNRARVTWLFENKEHNLPNPMRPACHRDKEHSYKSMYGRLSWGAPAQTITSGFGSPGQGRYIHPSRRRTLTPHEAARLQTIPDFFTFEGASNRGSRARMIGNAVPPLLATSLALELIPSAFPITEAEPVAVAA